MAIPNFSWGSLPPHPRHGKENLCGCAGCYTAYAALELYAEAFAAANALDQLEAFASFHGADFYGLPHNFDTVTLRRQPLPVPASFPFGAEEQIDRCEPVKFWAGD